jgi:hypothetical protein
MVDHLSFIDGLLARIDGPMSFRLVVQPLMAAFFAVRDSRRDVKEGKPPFFWALFTDAGHRRDLLRSGWKSVSKVFILAIILDLVFQYIAFKDFRPVAALITGVVLAILPYLLLRGPINRLWPKSRKADAGEEGGQNPGGTP